ncbi:MAG: DUF2203 domain-containing protein [Verrucomicrobia bacterium]|nr:DUF2203 domain-containing protein [Verrucomicrobiota bacterium]
MGHQFRIHYTLDEARALLPELRRWLERLAQCRAQLARLDQRLGQRIAQGCDVGGPSTNDWVRLLGTMKRFLREFHRRDLQIKDLDRGVVDFPAVLGGREVFLCWEKDEDDIEYWHDLNTGYARRERLP